ncbi:MAG: 16S rRNA processing protein RimM [Bacteroidetes bacterium]|nr:16S rRNA processing protein RimM [Bacteroidota bacterium]
MNSSDYFYLGKIVRTVGLKGEFAVQLDVDDPLKYQSVKKIFIAETSEFVAYKKKSARVNGMQLIISIEGTSDIDEAKKLIGKNIFLPLSDLPLLNDTRFYFHEIPGYEVSDAHHGVIGIAEEVMERSIQPVLVVKKEKTEILIPLAENIIQKIDRKNKTLYINAPEGLIDIYLNKSSSSEEE